MKVALYVYNANYGYRDYTDVEKGNPGIGGTEFMIIWLATILANRENGIDVTLYCQVESKYTSKLCVHTQETLELGYIAAGENKNDFFIFDAKWGKHINELCNKYDFKTKIIPWAHTFYDQYVAESFMANKNLECIVNVSKEQNELFIDHCSYKKSTYIHNCVIFSHDNRLRALNNPFGQRKHIVTFVGALAPNKSFHILARIWPDIVMAVPDAELYIVGSGTLYGKQKQLGKYGLASEEYEEKFIKYIVDEDGSILPSVHFMGNMGEEKYEILLQTKVGIPNPAGLNETFCISAVEMQAMGCYVLAMRSPGYFDTFFNGEMVTFEHQLKKKIIDLLLAESLESKAELGLFLDKFSPEKIANDWESLLNGKRNANIDASNTVFNKWYRLKFLKLVLRRIKDTIPLCMNIIAIETLLRKIPFMRINN